MGKFGDFREADSSPGCFPRPRCRRLRAPTGRSDWIPLTCEECGHSPPPRGGGARVHGPRVLRGPRYPVSAAQSSLIAPTARSDRSDWLRGGAGRSAATPHALVGRGARGRGKAALGGGFAKSSTPLTGFGGHFTLLAKSAQKGAFGQKCKNGRQNLSAGYYFWSGR